MLCPVLIFTNFFGHQCLVWLGVSITYILATRRGAIQSLMDGRRSRSVSRNSRRLAGVEDTEEEVINKENPFKNSPDIDNSLDMHTSPTPAATRNISTERNKHTSSNN